MIKASEWRWVFLVTLLTFLVSSLPVAIGFLAQTAEVTFSGAVYDRQDYAVHLGTMQLGAMGEWAYRMLFTSGTQKAIISKLAYIVLGQLAGLFSLNLSALFHIARFVGAIAISALIYLFMAKSFGDRLSRRIAFLLATLASGLGWLMMTLNWQPVPDISPIDFWLIDFYVFYSVATFPHFLWVIALILIIAIAYLDFMEKRTRRSWLLAAIAGLLILPVQPFSLAIADLVLLGIVIGWWYSSGRFRWSDLVSTGSLIIIQLPLLWLNLRQFTSDPGWSLFVEQNIVRSPPLAYIPLGMGLMGPLAIWGGIIAWRERHRLGVMSSVWVVGALLMSYAPTNLQRRFTLALTIPLALLTTLGLVKGMLPWLERRWKNLKTKRALILMLFVVASIPSTLYLSTGGALYASQRPSKLFDPSKLVEAIDWLKVHAEHGDAVFASDQTGLLIPPRTGLQTFVGHPIETLHYSTKVGIAEAFFLPNGMTLQERAQLLEDSGCNWVLVGPYELAGTSGMDLPENYVLQYQSAEVLIYQRSTETSD